MGQLIKVKDKNGKYVLKVVNSSQPMYIVNNKKRKEQFNQTQKKDTWFQKGAFSDGYDIGDIAKTILGTTSDVGINIGKGIVNAGEGLGKMLVGGVAELSEALGNKEYSNKLKNRLAGKDENFNKKREKYLFSSNLDKLENKIDKFSLIGEKTDNIATGLGNIGASIAGQSVGIPWYATMGGSSVGHELENAYSNDATDQEAWISAGISGLSEVIFEKLSGGIKFGGKTLDESIKRPLLNKISNQTVKTLSNYGIDMFGEGAEEVLTEIASNVGRKLTYKSEETWKTALASEEALNSYIESFISGALVSGIINSGKTYQIVKESKRKQIQEQELINIEQTQQELENNFQNGIITEEQYNQEMNNLSNRLKMFTKEIKTNKTNPITEIEVEKQLLDEQFNNNLITEEEYNNSLSSLDESLKELSSNNQTLTNPNKIDAFRETVNEYWDNSKESQEAKALIEKVIKDKDYNIILDPNIGNDVGGLATTNQNGEVEIRLNPNSNRAVEFLLVHEVTHAIENSSMKKFVMNFARKNPNFVRENPTFKNALKSLEQTYNSEDVSSEVLADISGQLLGNQDFINSLAMQNTAESKSIIKTIYEEIKRLLNTLTKDGRYRNFVQDLETKWREAYRTTTIEQAVNNLKNGTIFSIQTDINGNKYVNVDTDQNIFENIDIKEYNKIAKMYINDYLRGKTTLAENDSTIIDSKFASKYTNPGKKQPNFIEKMKLTPELKNVLKIAKKIKSKMPVKENSKYDSWEYYKFNFKIANQNFSGIVNIGIDKKGQKHFYEVNNIKKTSGISDISPNRPTGFSANTIPQSNKNVKSDNVSTKYSMQENQNNTVDSQGKQLSKEQQEYFKDSKVRDESGRLLVVYHGSNNTFDNFSTEYFNKNETMGDYVGEGFFFTKNKNTALKYGNNVKSVYLDIKNPLIINTEQDGINYRNSFDGMYQPTTQEEILLREEMREDSKDYDYFQLMQENPKIIREEVQRRGYDGLIDNDYGQYAVFNSNQIKNVDNTNPTSNKDIRYSQNNQTWQEHLEENYKSSGTKTKSTKYSIQNNNNNTQELDNSSFSLEKLPKIKEGYTRLYRGLKEKYDANYDRSKLDSPNGYDTLTDNYELAKQYGDNVYYIDIPTNQISNSVIDENPNSETYGDRNLAYKDDKPAGLNGISGNEYLLYTDHDNFNSQDYHEISEKTTNNDTKYSTDNKSWQKFLEDNYKATGKRTNMADIRRNTKNNTNNNTKQVMESNNIEPNPEIAKILEERPVTKEDTDNKLKKLLTIKIVDKGYYVDKLARQTKNKTLSSTYDYMLMANGIAQQSIGNERFNPKTQQYNGKGLHKIFEPIENSGQLQAFSEYMYHKHNVDRMDLEKKYNEENKPVFGDTVTSDVSQKIINKYEKSNPEFKNWAKEVYDYNNFLLDVLVDYGVITNEDKTYYNKKYPHYIPTIRATDKTKVQMDMFGKKASINTPIKTAKGGNQNIIPLKEAMALRTMQTMNSALRNRFGNELYNTINAEADISNVNLDETIGDNIDSDELLTKSTKEKPATLTIFKDGEKTTFSIPDEIYEALAPNKRYKIKAFNTVSQIRRGLLTEYNPAFMLTNPIKDVQDGALNSKHPALFLKNIPEASKQIATKGEYYKQYIANGGSYETYFNYGESYNKLPVKRLALDPRKILDKISNINQAIEMTPRLAEFISSVEAGDSIETAMYNAQEITTNFKRGGNWTKNLDANGVTFLNASVQGAVKQVRNFQEAKSQGIRGIANLSVKWSIAGLTPYLLSQMIWGDDDDYEELSDYVKNNYYILWKNNNGTFIRIPKGRVVSVIQNLFEQPLDALKGKKIDIPEFLELLQNQVLPSDPTESNIFTPITDVIQNKTWYGGDLVPQRLQSLPAGEQYDESTDSLSIWIGEKTGISPIKINYILDQYSGAIGDMLLPTLTLEAENDSNSALSVLMSPLKNKFTTDGVMNNQNISDLYDLDDKLTKKAKSSDATNKDVLKSKYLNSVQLEMNLLSKEQREIQNDKTLTNSEKYKMVKKIQRQINELAKQGINNYKNIKVYKYYSKVGEEEYYLNNKKEWVKIDDDEIKSLNKFGLGENDKNKYFATKSKITTITNNYEKDKLLLDENSSSYDYEKEKLSLTKRKDIINTLINENLSADAKAFIYNKYYGSEETTQAIINSNIDFNEYLKFVRTDYKSDKDSEGNTIKDSRKKKVFNAINKLNLSKVEKAMLVRLEYTSFDDYNYQIFKHIDDLNLSKKQKEAMFETFGFEVKGGRVYW